MKIESGHYPSIPLIHFQVFVSFILVTLLMTFPAIKGVDSLIDLGDQTLNTWILASNYHALITNPLNIFETNIFFPLSGTLTFSDPIITPVVLLFPLFVTIKNVVLLHNTIVLLNYVLSAFFAYLLAYELHRCWKSAYLAGFIYAFCHFSLSHIHWVQLGAQWIPFSLLFLIRYRNTQSVSSLCFFYLGLLFQVYNGLYYFIYLLLTIGIFFLCFSGDMLQVSQNRKRYFVGLFWGGIVALLIASPLAFTYLHTHHKYELGRTMTDLLVGKARWQDYLLPFEGTAFYSFYLHFFSLPQLYWEKYLFPGVLALLLTGVSVFSIRRQKNLFYNGYFCFFVAVGLFFLFLSFGPQKDGSLTLFSVFSGWFPGLVGIRVPARAGVMVALSVAILSSFGFWEVLKWLNRLQRVHFPILLLCLFLAGFEYWTPVHRVGDNPYQVESEIPDVYQWVIENVGDEVLVELPFSDINQETLRMYYSTFHWKKRVNGYSGYRSSYVNNLTRAGVDSLSAESVELLRTMGVKYIIFEKGKLNRSIDDLQVQGIDFCWAGNNHLVFSL